MQAQPTLPSWRTTTGQQESKDCGQQQRTTAAGSNAPTRAVHDTIHWPAICPKDRRPL
jgi:hypothetical protein